MGNGSILISLSIALLVGLLLTRVAKLVKLPAVTAYLIAGVLIGPYLLGSFGIKGLGIVSEEIELLKIISEVALGFIAFNFVFGQVMIVYVYYIYLPSAVINSRI